MRSRSEKSRNRKSCTSSVVSGPPMFNSITPVFGFEPTCTVLKKKHKKMNRYYLSVPLLSWRQNFAQNPSKEKPSYMDIVLSICIWSYVTWNHLTLLSTSIDREAHFLRPSGPAKGKYTRKIQKTHWMYKKWMFTYQFLVGKLHSLNWQRTFWDRTLVKDMVDNFWEVASIVMVEYLEKSTKCTKSRGNCSWNISFKTYCDLSVLYDKILRPFWGTIQECNIDQL